MVSCVSSLLSLSLQERTFRTLDFYRKHQDRMTPAGLAFFQSQWDESVTDTFHGVLCESSRGRSPESVWEPVMSGLPSAFRYEGAGVRVHQTSSLPPAPGQIPPRTAAALPGPLQRRAGTHLWDLLKSLQKP